MIIFSFQTKRRLKKLGLGLLIALGLLLLAGTIALVWLQRYLVYTPDGVHLDFSRSTTALRGGTPAESATLPEVALRIDDGTSRPTGQAIQQISGFYADTAALTGGISKVREALSGLEAGSAVMLDVKSIYGNFYYSTSITGAPTSDSISPAEMDALIADLAARDLYLIARLPAFRDTAFALKDPSAGLPMASGVLWVDSKMCYWLDPADQAVLNYLTQICRELQTLGFDEVVFDDFLFPSDESIVYDDNVSRTELIHSAAQALAAAFPASSPVISFCSENADFPLPEGGSCRLYLTGVDGAQVSTVAAGLTLADPAAQLVFLAETRDTRYDTFSVLRAIS